ncbi:hypothetical protein M3Y98_00834200 [Aphelenchoides besseyi]|nr:hypothetical protein M3Y98_00834200 [Aphelenchoides besseyi]KAI6195448.1 hypothetical protein M3Y96_01232500 [Aphelenchoides besseyi]
MGDYRVQDRGSDDETDEGLFEVFESASTSVHRLFINNSWRNFQSTAASTTLLYKSGLEAKKRAYERGYQNGRLQLAKELVALKRYNGSTKVELQDLYALLSKYALIPNDHSIGARQRSSNNQIESTQAVNLFQQALNSTGSPNSHLTSRSPELNNFLQHQLHRHRKRAHSPMDVMNGGNSPTPQFHPQHFYKRKRM